MRSLEAAKIRMAAPGLNFLGLAKKHPCAGQIDVLQTAALERDLLRRTRIHLAQSILEGRDIAEQPVAFEANRQRVIDEL